jgi:hypothetical protein
MLIPRPDVAHEFRKSLLEICGHVVGRIDEPIIFDGVNPDATLLQAMYVLTKKAFLIFAPLIEFRVMPHLENLMRCHRLNCPEQYLK